MSTTVAAPIHGTFAAPAPFGSSASRSRPQGRRKPNDDAMYTAPGDPVASAKRAHERVDGEPRVKRKRVDHVIGNIHAHQHHGAVTIPKPNDTENTTSMMEFASLPTSALYRYMAHYDLVPAIYPSPLGAEDPPPPSALLEPARMVSRAPSPVPITTPANRPRRGRESKEASRRRSSRVLDEEVRPGIGQTPVLADVGELHGVLASIAGRHFRAWGGVKEVDTLAAFMCAVKGKGERR